MAKGLLRLLSNEKNQSILGLLVIEPSYPRRLADILELSETDVARRLRRMKDAGLVTSEWAQVGQNVKLYKVTSDRFTLRIAPDGLHFGPVEGERSRPVARTEPVQESLPTPSVFVGRQRELEAIAQGRPVTLVLGLPGIGKTSLVAHQAARDEKRGAAVFWCACRGVESFNWLVHRLALFFSKHGDPRLLRAIEQEAEPPDKWELMVASMDKEDHLFVFDDAHKIQDDLIHTFLEDAAGRVGKGRIILASRQTVKIQPDPKRVRTLNLEGLGDDDVAAYLEAHGMKADAGSLGRLRSEIGGHPLALNLLVGSAQSRELPLDRLLEGVHKQDLENYLLREVSDTLSDDERRVISLASLFRTRFTIDDLQAMTKSPVDGPLLRLRRRLLIEPRGEGYFLHETLRNFFHDHLSDRKRLHQRVAECYLESGTDEGRLEAMHHLLAADRRDRVLELLQTNLDLREFERIDAGYHDLYYSVLGMFRREEVADDRLWALMEDERGDILYHRGDLEGALVHYEEAMGYFQEQDDPSHAADLSWKRALTLSRLGRTQESRAVRKQGLKVAPLDGLTRKRLERL